MKKNTIAYVCFGEINTPIERLQMKHDEALEALKASIGEVVDGGLVIDDPAYETADAAYAKLEGKDIDCLIVCVAISLASSLGSTVTATVTSNSLLS